MTAEPRSRDPRAAAEAADGPLRGVSAMVLVGGEGSRLSPHAGGCPKPLLEIGGRPLLAYVLDQILAAGITEVVLCCGYRAEEIEASFGTCYRGLRLVYSVEDTALGTAGALSMALPLVREPRVLILHGDSICQIELRRFVLDTATEDCALVGVAVAERRGHLPLQLGAEGGVTGFLDPGSSAGPGWVDAGIYAMSRARLAGLPRRAPLSLQSEVLPQLHELRAWRTRAPYLDVDTPRHLATAATFLDASPRGLLLLVGEHNLITRSSDGGHLVAQPGAMTGLRRLHAAGYRVALVTFGARTDPQRRHAQVTELLHAHGCRLDGIWHCPHAAGSSCHCRSSEASVLAAAGSTLGVAMRACTVLAADDLDLEMARQAGAQAIPAQTRLADLAATLLDGLPPALIPNAPPDPAEAPAEELLT